MNGFCTARGRCPAPGARESANCSIRTPATFIYDNLPFIFAGSPVPTSTAAIRHASQDHTADFAAIITAAPPNARSLEDDASSGQQLSLYDEMTKLALVIIGDVLFGVDLWTDAAEVSRAAQAALAVLLAWTWYLLSLHPEVERTLIAKSLRASAIGCRSSRTSRGSSTRA